MGLVLSNKRFCPVQIFAIFSPSITNMTFIEGKTSYFFYDIFMVRQAFFTLEKFYVVFSFCNQIFSQTFSRDF